jgi:iron complex transport system ATP-binding protein
VKANQAQPLLEIDGLDLHGGGRLLLRQLRLQVRRGERWALLGCNGAGKSTLLRELAGFGAGGALRLDGSALAALAPHRLAALRAYMPGQARDRFGIGVLHAVMLGQAGADAAAARQCLRDVDCLHLEQRHLLQLSAGERQRVALAQALAQRTPLLLLDEPVSFQDPAHQGRVAQRLAALHDRAIVFAAHDLNWVAGLATHVLGFVPGGDWVAGPRDAVLRERELERLYGCAWQRVARPGGAALWVTA